MSAVALSGATVVEVHKSDSHDTLWSRIGVLKSGMIQWQPQSENKLSVQYDNGVWPSVALSGTTVVEVHKSDNEDTLWYHIGDILQTSLGLEIHWGESVQYDNGVMPAVALSGTTVVEVHKSDSHDTLWSRIGDIVVVASNIKKIQWRQQNSGKESVQYDNGVWPRVAPCGTNFVEVHQSNNEDTLWNHIGIPYDFPIGRPLVWSPSHRYDNGVTPAVALSDLNVVEVHKSNNEDTLWCRIGDVKAWQIQWQQQQNSGKESAQYDNGVRPQVALSGPVVVEVHQSNNEDTLWYRVGVLELS